MFSLEAVQYWDDRDAALALSEGLAVVAQFEKDRSKWEWSMPPHVAEERDNAVARVKAAVRHLCAEKPTDPEATS